VALNRRAGMLPFSSLFVSNLLRDRCTHAEEGGGGAQ